MDSNTKQIIKDAWFKGMEQGIITDRQDRLKTHTTTETLSKRISFDDWWVSQKMDNCECGATADGILYGKPMCERCLHYFLE